MPLIDKRIYREIERELFNYPEKRKAIKEKTEEILYGSSPPPETPVSGGQIGNQTMTKAVKLLDINDGWVKVIEDALKGLSNEYRTLIEMIYFKHRPVRTAADELHISLSLCYAWKENIIYYLALRATQRRIIEPFRDNP